LAVGKARQSANPTSSWQRDLFAECRKKQLAKKITVGKEPVSCSAWCEPSLKASWTLQKKEKAFVEPWFN
jgi:hypothetical protein